MLNQIKRHFHFFLPAMFAFCFAGFSNAFAAAPNIQGSIEIEVEMGNVVNNAVAADSVAQVAIGSVSSGSMGTTKIKVVHGDVVNTATGTGSCAQVLIGSIGVPSCVAGAGD